MQDDAGFTREDKLMPETRDVSRMETRGAASLVVSTCQICQWWRGSQVVLWMNASVVFHNGNPVARPLRLTESPDHCPAGEHRYFYLAQLGKVRLRRSGRGGAKGVG